MITTPSVIENAATIRGIVELLSEEPATDYEIEITQHITPKVRSRLMKILWGANIVEKGTVAVNRVHRGKSQQVPITQWKLTATYIKGEIALNPQALASMRPAEVNLLAELKDIFELLKNHPAHPKEIESICKLSTEERRHHMELLIGAGVVEIYRPSSGALKGYKLSNAARSGKLQFNQVLRGVLA